MLPSKLGEVDELEEAKEAVGASKLEEVKKPEDATKSKLQLDQIIQIKKEANYSIENNVQAHCFIQTSSLDGEKNLKKRLTPKDLNIQYKNNQIASLRAKCICDEPNSELY